MLAWAIRIFALWGAIGVVGYLLLDEWTTGSVADVATTESPAASGASANPIVNSMVVRADPSGHYLVNASVDGFTVRFLVDTGASLVVLSPKDAEAAGISKHNLRFTGRAHTANGISAFAPVTISELRIGQASFRNVEAAVMQKPMNVSLLGMALLKRLDSYEIRDGRMTMWW